MINNRQNGRRRGRGGPRPQGMDGRPNGGGNRQDVRARGNAPQLHEKYKAMARDAQLAGDRVQTEYYLQFADHYYRILNENRPRFDEARSQRENGSGYAADDYEDEDGDESGGEDAQGRDDGDEAPARQQPRARDGERPRDSDRDARRDRPQRDVRPEREPRAEREDRPQRAARFENEDRPDRVRPEGRLEREAPREAEAERADAAEPARERPRRTRSGGNGSERPARPVRDDEAGGPGIDFDRLPPAIARTDPEPAAEADSEDDRPRPARRPRRPREGTPVAA